MADGQVLVAGGQDPQGNILATAELYDPASNSWSETGPMIHPRSGHTATRLANGRVLVTGGGPQTGATAELYDPTSHSWQTTASMAANRWFGGSAILLGDGTVLLAGGENNGGPLTDVEIYDPATGTWSETTPLPGDLANTAGVLLANGDVLLTGFDFGSQSAVSVLYDSGPT